MHNNSKLLNISTHIYAYMTDLFQDIWERQGLSQNKNPKPQLVIIKEENAAEGGSTFILA